MMAGAPCSPFVDLAARCNYYGTQIWFFISETTSFSRISQENEKDR